MEKWNETAWKVATAAANLPAKEIRTDYRDDGLRSVSTRIREETVDELKQMCDRAGTTRYALLNYMARAWMAARDVIEGREPDERRCTANYR